MRSGTARLDPPVALERRQDASCFRHGVAEYCARRTLLLPCGRLRRMSWLRTWTRRYPQDRSHCTACARDAERWCCAAWKTASPTFHQPAIPSSSARCTNCSGQHVRRYPAQDVVGCQASEGQCGSGVSAELVDAAAYHTSVTPVVAALRGNDGYRASRCRARGVGPAGGASSAQRPAGRVARTARRPARCRLARPDRPRRSPGRT